MAYGCTITVQAGQMPSAQTGFVWLFTHDNLPTGAIDGGVNSINNGGGNLRCYTDSSKTTRLPIEVVSFVTGGTPQVQVWGRSTSLGVGSTVYVEADDTATAQPPVTDVYGRNSVWVDFLFRFNFFNSLVDSSGNLDDLTNNGAVSIPGGGYSFDGSSSSMSGSISNLNPSQFYIDAWVIRKASKWQVVCQKQNDDFWFGFAGSSAFGGVKDAVHFNADGVGQVGVNPSTQGVKTLISGLYNGATVLTYIDAVSGDNPKSKTRAFVSSSDNIYIGSKSSGSDRFNGDLFSLSARVVAPTQDRITSDYNNQNSPTSFWSTSAWEDQGGGGSITADLNLSINKPVFSVQASKSEPSFNASLSFEVSKPVFSVQADNTAPSSGATVALNVSNPVFSVQATKEDPPPAPTETVDVNFEVSNPVFSVQASNLGVGNSANVNITTPKPQFSVQASRTIPDTIANADITINGPIFTIYAGTDSDSFHYADGSIAYISAESKTVSLPSQSRVVTIKSIK